MSLSNFERGFDQNKININTSPTVHDAVKNDIASVRSRTGIDANYYRLLPLVNQQMAQWEVCPEVTKYGLISNPERDGYTMHVWIDGASPGFETQLPSALQVRLDDGAELVIPVRCTREA